MDRSMTAGLDPMMLVPPLTPTRARGLGGASGVVVVGACGAVLGAVVHADIVTNARRTPTTAVETLTRRGRDRRTSDLRVGPPPRSFRSL
ncbi:hypothetical protein GCM10009722_39210 [Williamsia deligens]